MKNKILVLAPHADDEILGCGGLISKYSKQNYKIYVLIITNDNKGVPELFNSKQIELLRKEAQKANNFIGTHKLFFENLPAVTLEDFPTYKLVSVINKYIHNINPEIVLIPSINDIHEDHKTIYKAAKISLRPNKKSNIKKILSYETVSETEWNEEGKLFNPNYFIRLSKSEINRKTNAFLKYKSQLKKSPHPRSKEGIINLAKIRGAQAFAEYAEAFKIEKILD